MDLVRRKYLVIGLINDDLVVDFIEVGEWIRDLMVIT